MMFDKVRIYYGTVDAESFIFPLDENILTSPYIVKSIEGLDPPKVNVSKGNKLFEGSVYQGKRPVDRQIVMNVALKPDYSLGQSSGDLRTALYPLMTPKLGQQVRFYLMSNDESEWVRTYGFISSIEANPFTKDPQVQIVMDCLGPYFEHGGYVHPNPSTFNGDAYIELTNEGDAPAGFGISFTLTAALSNFYIRNENDTERFTWVTTSVVGDTYWLSTHNGDRYTSLVRSGVTTNMLPWVNLGSSWLQLHAGVNRLYLSTTSYTVSNLWWTSKRWGV